MGFLAQLRRRFRKSESGSTAIEFAMVFGPFLGIMFAIMEVSLVYFGEFSLQSAIETKGRAIFVGSVQTNHITKEQFKTTVCEALPVMMSCDENLKIDVRSFDTFREAANDLPNPFNADGTLSNSFEKFDPGGPSKVVVVSVFYKWNFFITMPGLGDFTGKMGISLGNMPDGSRLLSTGFAFKNEPYQGP